MDGQTSSLVPWCGKQIYWLLLFSFKVLGGSLAGPMVVLSELVGIDA